MWKRALGNSGLEVPAVTLGGNVFGWTVDEAATFRLLDRAVDLGLTFIDTADIYSKWVPGNRGGESETLIGKWLARSGKRDKVTIATKAGMELGLSIAHLNEAVEASLRRLQTDYIDLYFAHKDDPATPLDQTLSIFEVLIAEGKIRAAGASNYSGARLREALAISDAYTVLQPHYNLLERADYESDLAPVVAEHNLGVVPYFSLASGFLTGKYRKPEDLAGRARSGGAGKYLNERGLKVLAALDEIARGHNATDAQVALAWLIAQPGITSPIASATNPDQLEDLARAADLKLDSASLAKLSAASSVRS
ncbi:MAG: aldo/keto reductase [Acidobacteriota bacterium]|nr:aldo/keto reductase [Acidobacteriota bacterium]